MDKVIFLDRDGTLNLDNGYTYKIEDYKILPGVKKGLKKLQDFGFKLMILTNQSGVARGMYSEEDLKKFMAHMIEDLKKSEIEILNFYYCPHYKEKGKGEYKIDCDCRKPKSGLVLKAIEDYGPFDYEKSWSVGDSLRDVESTKNVNSKIRSVLLPKNAGTQSQKELCKSEEFEFKVKNFLEAVDIILNN